MNVVVTGGGTIAPIDDVRHVANASTGRFSAAITEACLRHGAAVCHIHAPGAERPFDRFARFNLDAADPDAEVERLRQLRQEWRCHRERLQMVGLRDGTVSDYARRLESVLKERPVDIVFLAMAVSDFEPEPYSGKLDSEAETVLIRTFRTPKVIQRVRDWAPGVFLVGFKLLSRSNPSDLIATAEEACVVNRADLTIANDLQTVRAGRHTVHLVRPGFPAETIGPADDLAAQVVERVVALAETKRRRTDAS